MKTEDIELFHRVAESGSMAKVATILNLPKSNLSRRIQALEEQLKVGLFHRQNRALVLTEKGRQFYRNTKPLLSQFHQVLDEVMETSEELSGNLRVQMLPLMPMSVVQQKILAFITRHPKVTVEIKVSSEHEDIKKEQIDVAFRIGEFQQDSSLIARPYQSTTVAYFASPGYLAQHGEPQDYDDLRQHNFCRFRFPTGEIFNDMPRGEQGGTVTVGGNLVVNNPFVMKAFGLEGHAIIFLPEEIVADEVAAGRLVKLFADKPEFVGTEWVVYSSRRHLSPTARAFIDFLFEDHEVPTIIGHPFQAS